MPLGRALRPLYAWYGAMELVPHLLEALSRGSIEVTIAFHPLLRASDFPDRKGLSRHCHARVADGVDPGARQEPEEPPWQLTCDRVMIACYSVLLRDLEVNDGERGCAHGRGIWMTVPREVLEADRKKSLFIKTYGCQMNVYDSERMTDILARSGVSYG